MAFGPHLLLAALEGLVTAAVLAITALDGEPGIDGVQPVEASSQAVVIGLDSAPDEPVPAALIGGPSPRWLSLGRLRRKVQFSAAGLTDLLPPVVVNLDPDPAREEPDQPTDLILDHALTPSRSRPVRRTPTTYGTRSITGIPNIALSASISPTPQASTPIPLIIGVWLSVPISVSG